MKQTSYALANPSTNSSSHFFSLVCKTQI